MATVTRPLKSIIKINEKKFKNKIHGRHWAEAFASGLGVWREDSKTVPLLFSAECPFMSQEASPETQHILNKLPAPPSPNPPSMGETRLFHLRV